MAGIGVKGLGLRGEIRIKGLGLMDGIGITGWDWG